MSCPSLRAAPAALSQATPACRGRAAARCGAFVVQRPAVQAQRRATTAAAARRRQLVVAAAASAPSATTPHVQLATAKLPAGVDATRFKESLFQWAATLTQNGRNLPFALPLDVTPLADGFKISLLRVVDGGAVLSVADVVATVEAVAGAGDVLFVRLYEGRGAAELGMGGGAATAEARLKTMLPGLVDIPIIMETMKEAIKRAVLMAR